VLTGDARSVATSGGDDGDKASSLMLAENMEAGQSEQKLRAKRDLDADQIRELFASQRESEPADDYFAPGISLVLGLRRMHERQTIATDVHSVCLSVSLSLRQSVTHLNTASLYGGHSLGRLPNHFGFLFIKMIKPLNPGTQEVF